MQKENKIFLLHQDKAVSVRLIFCAAFSNAVCWGQFRVLYLQHYFCFLNRCLTPTESYLLRHIMINSCIRVQRDGCVCLYI